MTLSDLLQASPALFYCLSALLGLLIGSFLNVVIYRVPLMMQRDWEQQCQDYLSEQLPETSDQPQAETPALSGHAPESTGLTTDRQPFNLFKPDSHCPACQSRVRPWQNIPLLSYILLRGRCAHCDTKIPRRYPITELLTAAVSVLVAVQFGPEPACLAALLLAWTLIALAIIDIDHQLLPDNMTLPLLWLGLLLTLTPWGLGTSTSSALIGAAAGYLSLWSLYWAYKLLTGREGMGYGDFKLLAALGAWMGWQALPQIILLSSLAGAVVGIVLIVLRRQDRSTPIPFGPYLSGAGFISLLWGDSLSRLFFSAMG